MKSKVSTLITALALAGLSAGCGGTGTTVSGNCDSADPVKIGVLIGLTGPNADNGALHADGTKMAAEVINEDGGIDGRCLELIVRDDKGEPAAAAQQARALVSQDRVVAVEGTQLSSATGAALELTTPARIVQVVASSFPAAADPNLNPYAFLAEVPSSELVAHQVEFLQSQGLEKVGVMAVNDAFGTASLDALEASIEGTGIEIAGEPQLFQAGTANLTAQARSVADAGADSILILSVGGPDQVATIKARNLVAPGLPMVGNAATPNKDTVDAFTAKELEGVYAGPFYRAATYDAAGKPISPEMARFVEDYKEFAGTSEDLQVNISQVEHGYENIMMLVAAIDGAGSTDSEDIKEWLESNVHEGIAADYTFSEESHAGVPADALTFVYPKTLKNGIYQIVDGRD